MPIGASGLSAFGGWDPSQYYAANPDVKASGMDALKHYETFGFKEERSLDPAGHKINQAFDVAAYFDQNPDVLAAHADPLQHYLVNGAHEGRALPIGGAGITPYSFANFNAGVMGGSGGNNVADWGGAYRPGFTGYNGSNGAPNPSAGFYGDGAAIQASNSAKSQANHFAIEANNAANWAASQDAADFNRQNIGPGAPVPFITRKSSSRMPLSGQTKVRLQSCQRPLRHLPSP